MKPSKYVRIRVGPADLRERKTSAKKNELSLSEYIRRRVNGRPLKARKPKAIAREPERLAENTPSDLRDGREHLRMKQRKANGRGSASGKASPGSIENRTSAGG